jgi:hypothetical protein
MKRGDLALVARLHQAERNTHPDVSKLEATQQSLAQARDLIGQLERRLEAERCARRDAHAETRSAQLAAAQARCDADTAAEAFRRVQVALEKKFRAQLKELEEALVYAEYRAYRHAQRHAELAAALNHERRLRDSAETQLTAERRAREEHMLAVSDESDFWNGWKKRLRTLR